MWRMFLVLGLIVFGIGAAAGVVLAVMLALDREFREVARVVIGSGCLAFGAFACRRDLQRLRQEREFRGESK